MQFNKKNSYFTLPYSEAANPLTISLIRSGPYNKCSLINFQMEESDKKARKVSIEVETFR